MGDSLCKTFLFILCVCVCTTFFKNFFNAVIKMKATWGQSCLCLSKGTMLPKQIGWQVFSVIWHIQYQLCLPPPPVCVGGASPEKPDDVSFVTCPFPCRSSVRCCTQTGLTGRVWCSMWPRSTSTLRRKPSHQPLLPAVCPGSAWSLSSGPALPTAQPSGFPRKAKAKWINTQETAEFHRVPISKANAIGV